MMVSLKHEPPKWDQVGCPLCGGNVVYTDNSKIYGRSYGNGKCYLCVNCGAYCSVHDDPHKSGHYPSRRAKGMLADKKMRKLRMCCHHYFDSVWRNASLGIKRQELYKCLAVAMGIPKKRCHFGWFDLVDLTKAKHILEDAGWYEADLVKVRLANRCNQH